MTTRNPLRSFIHPSLLSAVFALTGACGGMPETAHASDPLPDGPECRSGADCPSGWSCEDDACVAPLAPECAADAECATGQHCVTGSCVAMLPVDPTPVDPTPAPEVCAKGELDLVGRPANVVVLVDQSASMEKAFDGGNRWDVLRNALLDEQTGVIKLLENDVRFGVALYSSENGFGRSHGRTCPLLTGLDEIPIALGNFSKIRDVYAAASPVDDTPTAESLAAVTDKLVALPEAGMKAIVLATDGEPDTCEDPDAHNADTNRLTVETARSSFAAGVRTYVLSVGTEIAETHLQDMANAGAGVTAGAANAPFFRATDQAGLKSALSSIVTDVRSCNFHLDGTLDTRMVKNGTVLFDGAPIVYDTDFTLDTNGDLVLVGARCEAVKAGNHHVSAEFPCVKDGVPVVK